jgi:hypothetical protein
MINSIDSTMMSEEYPIMIIRGLPMILICEIMITIKKKSEMYTLSETSTR